MHWPAVPWIIFCPTANVRTEPLPTWFTHQKNSIYEPTLGKSRPERKPSASQGRNMLLSECSSHHHAQAKVRRIILVSIYHLKIAGFHKSCRQYSSSWLSKTESEERWNLFKASEVNSSSMASYCINWIRSVHLWSLCCPFTLPVVRNDHHRTSRLPSGNHTPWRGPMSDVLCVNGSDAFRSCMIFSLLFMRLTDGGADTNFLNPLRSPINGRMLAHVQWYFSWRVWSSKRSSARLLRGRAAEHMRRLRYKTSDGSASCIVPGGWYPTRVPHGFIPASWCTYQSSR